MAPNIFQSLLANLWQTLTRSSETLIKSCISQLLPSGVSTMQSCAHYFFPSSARHQDYQKPGKPSMATSSSSALEEREPTSASRLRGWGPEPRWSARCVSRNKFAATLCGFVLSLCYNLCAALDSSKNACVVSFFFFCLLETFLADVHLIQRSSAAINCHVPPTS